MTESDGSDSDLLVLDDTGRRWKNSDRGTKQKTASKQTVNVSRTSSSTSRETTREDPPRHPPSRQVPPVPQAKTTHPQKMADDEESESEKEEADEIPYLSEVAEEHRENVKIILSLDMPIVKKLEKLEDCVLVKVHRKFEQWLNEQENTTDFIKFLPEKCKKLATDWEAKKDVECLDPLVKKEGNEKAKEAYERWKAKHGLVKPLQEQSEVKIQEGPPAEDPPSKDRPVRVKKPDKPQDTPRKPRPPKDPHSGRRPRPAPHKDEPKKPPVKVESDHYDTADKAADAVTIPEEPSIFPENMPKETTVVILGGSGVGKSTFINATANWLAYQTLEEARENPMALINAEFTHISENTNDYPIKFDANYGKESQAKTSEQFSQGESVTQFACSYTFKVGSSLIRIVDTPGVNDTKGSDQDAKNFAEIVNYLGRFKKIDAFIFMLPPNESRLDLRFRYSMNELLKQLHSSAAQNIVFCMSNGRGTNYRPGETYNVLKTYLRGIHETRNIKIEMEGRIFVFDSEIFRYICAYNNAIHFTERELAQIRGSWECGRRELRRMLHHISTLKPHDVVNTLSVTKVRRVIEKLAGPLAEISKTHTENMQLIEQQRRHLEQCMTTGEDLRDKLHAEEIHMETEDLENPITVCAHRNCVTLQELHPYGAKEIVYTQECHEGCYIPDIKIGEYPNENIKKCEIFGDVHNENRCTVCGHGYEQHLHLKYRLVRRVIRIVNKEISEELDRNEDQISIAQAFIAEREIQRLQYEKDLDQKQNTCAHFAVFLKKNGIVHYNDQYLVYLNKQIRELEEQAEENPELLTRLLNSRAQYLELVKIFERTADVTGAKSVEEIEDLIRQLEASQDGHLLSDVQAIEQSVADRAILTDTAVVQLDDRTKWDKLMHKVGKRVKEIEAKIRSSKPDPPKPKPRSSHLRTRPPNDYYASGWPNR